MNHPINTLTDIQLVRSVKKKGDNESFNEICNRYEKIFYKICHKYSYPLSNSGVPLQDILDEKNTIIYNCICTFKKNKGTKLGSYIGNYTRYLCLNSINQRKLILQVDNEEIHKYVEENQTNSNQLENTQNELENYQYVFNLLGQLKDTRIIDIFKYRYCGNKKMVWQKISKKIGLSTQATVNLHNKGLELIKNKINSKEISDIV